MKIVVLEPLGIPQADLENLLAPVVKDHELVCYADRKEDTPTLIERAKDADAVVLTNFPFKKEVMENCPNLKYICVAFTGYNHVDMDYCKERGIVVSNCAGYSTEAVADLTFGLIINLYRHICEYNATTRTGGTKGSLTSYELSGKKFGVVGLGTIGRKVADIASAFGCEVVYWSRNKKDVPYKYVELDELIATSDIISLHVAQNKDTLGLISRERIATMKKNAVLINTARGPIVDSMALSAALNEDRIAGAGIDVFEMEPPLPLDHPLLHAKNCLVLPHIGFYTKEALEKRAVIVKDNIDGYLTGNVINKVS